MLTCCCDLIRWSAIATHLPGRTDNEIKNFWNTHLKKRLIQMGFDPMTHRPRTDFFDALPQLVALAALRDQLGAAAVDISATAQLQGAGTDVVPFLQAAKLQYLQCLLQSAATTIASASAGSSAVSPSDVEAALVGAAACSPQGTAAAGAATAAASASEAGDHQMLTTFSGAPVTVSDDLLLGSCGATGDLERYCHGGSLPPLADLSDATDGRCSATASSSFGGGASSPLPWPEFFPYDDPFITDFL